MHVIVDDCEQQLLIDQLFLLLFAEVIHELDGASMRNSMHLPEVVLDLIQLCVFDKCLVNCSIEHHDSQFFTIR